MLLYYYIIIIIIFTIISINYYWTILLLFLLLPLDVDWIFLQTGLLQNTPRDTTRGTSQIQRNWTAPQVPRE